MAFTKINAAGIGTTETVTVDGLTVINNGSFGGNLSVGGTLTYEDVTNVDSVGLITARNGIVVGSGITLSKDGDVFATGVTTTGSLVSSGAISGTTGTFTGDVDIADKIVHTGDTDTAIRFSGADTITAETGGSERLRIDSSGRLLLGTTTEGYASADDLTIATSGATGITIRSGTASGGTVAYSDGTSGDAEYRGYLQYDHNVDGLKIGTAGAERVRIDSSGRMSLGTTDASQFNAGADDFVIQRSGSCGITIDATSSTNSNIYFADGPTGSEAYRGFVQYQHATDRLILGASGADQVEITAGNVEITDGDLVIGTSGHGISFAITGNGATVSSELLDDYEEGTWTPVLNGTHSNMGTGIGKYAKVGSITYYWIEFGHVTAGNGSFNANTYISGFPFSTPNHPPNHWTGTSSYMNSAYGMTLMTNYYNSADQFYITQAAGSLRYLWCQVNVCNF